MNLKYLAIVIVIVLLITLFIVYINDENNDITNNSNEAYQVTIYLIYNEDFKINGTYHNISLFIDDELKYKCNKSDYPLDAEIPHSKFVTDLRYGKHEIRVVYDYYMVEGNETIFLNKDTYLSSVIKDSHVEINMLDGPLPIE
jgi:hypothetical protein